jgi:hypothetical protein
MTTHAPTASGATRTLALARDWLGSSRHQALTAVALYAALSIGYFGLHVVPHLGRVCVCEPNGTDPSGYMWNLAWWPHALLHGLNPFVTDAVFAPDGVHLGGEGMLVPGAAIVAAPITLLFGPVVSWNLLMLTSPVLAAFFAFLLCRYVTRSFAASLVGGYLFGFSAYMLGHMLGHLNLVLIFPIPAAVHLTLRLMDGRIGERKFILLMALALALLLLSSTELIFTFVLLGGAALVIALALAPRARGRVVATIKPILFAGILAAVVTSPVIYYGLTGVVQFPPAIGDSFGGDALGFLVPTSLIHLGRHYFAAVSARFTSGDPAEGGIYVGVLLALIVAHYMITRWRLVSTRILAAILAVIVVLLLGSHLHIAGYPSVPLPWKVIDHSLIREVLPARLGVYMFLIVAVITAMWLAPSRAGNRGLAKWALVAVSIAFLVPNIGAGWWRWSPPNPAFFTTNQYRTILTRGETALVLPANQFGMSMLWQAETGMWFRLAGGYLGTLVPSNYVHDPLTPAFAGQVKPDPETLRSFLARRHVGAVIVDPANPQQWPGALAALGLKPQAIGGVWVYRV